MKNDLIQIRLWLEEVRQEPIRTRKLMLDNLLGWVELNLAQLNELSELKEEYEELKVELDWLMEVSV